MGCSKDHCCKGGCYFYCETVICRGGYNSDCHVPVGQIDCLEVVNYSAESCRQPESFEVDEGILHVRNNCRASFKICRGPGFQEGILPSIPNGRFPVSTLNNKVAQEHKTISANKNHQDIGIILTNQEQRNLLSPPFPNDKFAKGTLHTDMTTDMTDSQVMAVDLGIGIGIGVFVAILAVIAVILCRRYHLKKKLKGKTPHPVLSSTNQAGNPLYCVDSGGSINRTSILSHRYDEVACPSNILSRTSSEAKYESIPSDTLDNRTRNDQILGRINSDLSSDYQMVADDISNRPKLKQTNSEVVYNTYFPDSNSSGRTSATASAQYFVLDPEETSRQIETEQPRIEIQSTDNTYFVLEKQ